MTARDTFDLTLTRTIRAPRAKVFDAFVNPDQLRRWFGPRGHTVAEATVDAKVGGRYRLLMQPMAGRLSPSAACIARSRRPRGWCSPGSGKARTWARWARPS